MGRNRSSSKRKSSKRKSSKISVEARKKKKNRTTKSKKLRHPKDSSCSSDDSRSSVSISSSSSEDEYHRVCSRRESELKGSRKRARERSSTRSNKFGKIKKSQKKKLRRVPSFTSMRSDSCSCSKNSGRSGTRKKLQKKRRKREPSVTSITSDSHIFSTCRGGFSSDENSKLESHRGRSREKSKGERDSDKTKSIKVRSRSCSPSGWYNNDSDSGKLILPVENSSRRLRSVITVVKSPEDVDRECDQDGLKEEIVQDHNDYPSCRSNDSTDGGNKRDLADCSHVDLEIGEVEILKRQEDSIFDFRPTDLTKGCGGGGAVGHLSSLIFDGAGINNSVNENKREVSPILNNRKNDDLESVLRLKALENLKKYRGAQQTKTKTPMRLGSLKVEEQSPTAVITSESESSTLPNKTQMADSLVAESTVNNNSGLTSERMGQKQMSNNDEQDKKVPKSSICEPSSSLKPTVEEHSLREHQSTDKDGSQFQQKTMSVMRGGEMVQVSYKVYIPKKAPALARRPLRR